MRTISLRDVDDSASVSDDVARVLRGGGLACVPCGGRYRIVADLENEAAVMHLMQAKGRVKAAPALIFIDSVTHLDRVAEHVPDRARALVGKHWPGPLTLRVAPHPDMPAKVLKQLGGRKCRIGVRVPADALMREVAAAVGGPLLVSSANRQQKAGDSSPAQVRKNFALRVDVFVDAGDLSPGPRSTVIDVTGDGIVVEREGAVDVSSLR